MGEMQLSEHHPYPPDASFDGGSLDCGNGLLLLIRKHIDPLLPGQYLEVRSTESSVEDDLPAWSNLTGNRLISKTRQGASRSYLIQKAVPKPERINVSVELNAALPGPAVVPAPLPVAGSAVKIGPLAVMGIGSWPRPQWLSRSLHEWLSGRLHDADFQRDANDAVRLAIASQDRAGVDVVSDGEQRRDNYASFVAARLENCQLIPVTDLLPYVTDPDHFAEELRALDVPADRVRHPAVFGHIRRSKGLTDHELLFARSVTTKPVKVALPGPYLLTRTMWLDCISDKAYPDRESLARDVVAVLREEAEALLALGAAIVQFDEPVLTEVVFSRPSARRSFMCGALGERREPREELEFAGSLLRSLLTGLPQDRLALHICRGNWSRDESVALTGPYTPLVPLLATLPVGTFFLELATPRAGDLEPLKELPKSSRIGVGVVNQKLDQVESVDEIVARAEKAIQLLGVDRVWLNPDCGFATFADSPVSSASIAEEKLRAIVSAAHQLRDRHGVRS